RALKEDLMKNPHTSYFIKLGLGLCLTSCCLPLRSDVFDDFNTGSDSSWSHYEPLAPFGAPGIYSFPDGGYRIQATASPDPGTVGPGRAGSLRSDLDITGNFLAGADLVDWDNNVNQSLGVFGRITSPGFGTTRGYAFTYSTAGLLAISVINNETLTALTSEAYRLNPAKDYHL